MKRLISGITSIFGVLVTAVGVLLKRKENISISTNGADGPSCIFLAGKIGKDSSTCLTVSGVIITVLGAIFFLKSKKHKK